MLQKVMPYMVFSYQVVFIGLVWRVSNYSMGILQDTMISLAIWMLKYYQRTAYDFQDLTPYLQPVPYLSSDEGVENHDFLRLSKDADKDNIMDSATVETTGLLTNPGISTSGDGKTYFDL